MDHFAHWDELEHERREIGHLAGTWTDLGTAAGSVTVGVTRIQVDPGKWSTPAHVEGSEEEIFYVLAGSGLSWQDGGEGGVAYEVGEGDCLVHLALAEAHSLRAGPEGLDVLAFGMRSSAAGITHLPRGGVAWLGGTWTRAGEADDHPWKREAEAGEPPVGDPMERPPSIVSVDEVEGVDFGPGETVKSVRRDLGRAAGSVATGLKHVAVSPGKLAVPPHCHTAEEEIFVVLDGEGTLLLGEAEASVRRGHVVARPAGTRVAHTLRAGDDGLTYLAYGTREPNDVAYYPRSQKIYWRGVGVVARVESLDYWDGEA
ncbi:MAG: cupin domain-containing protein [Actinomycetota bacterium]|nr:cupin domain-containing protein [Actinomycetota bacterium]